MIKALPRFSARSMVWSQRSSSTSSSMEKCALDSRTVSFPRAAERKFSPGMLCQSILSGLELCATPRMKSEGSRPVSNTTVKVPIRYGPVETWRDTRVMAPETRSCQFQRMKAKPNMAAPATPTSHRNALRVNVVFTTVSSGPGLPYLTGRVGPDVRRRAVREPPLHVFGLRAVDQDRSVVQGSSIHGWFGETWRVCRVTPHMIGSKPRGRVAGHFGPMRYGVGAVREPPDDEPPLCTLRITPGRGRCLQVVRMPGRGASPSARPSRWSRGLRRRVRG